jgi:hypothetical protein
MGNRLTENAKRTHRAIGAAICCPDCYGGGDAGPDGEPIAHWQFCDRHGCGATTRAGRRCCNSATYPEQRRCGRHLPPTEKGEHAMTTTGEQPAGSAQAGREPSGCCGCGQPLTEGEHHAVRVSAVGDLVQLEMSYAATGRRAEITDAVIYLTLAEAAALAAVLPVYPEHRRALFWHGPTLTLNTCDLMPPDGQQHD